MAAEHNESVQGRFNFPYNMSNNEDYVPASFAIKKNIFKESKESINHFLPS